MRVEIRDSEALANAARTLGEAHESRRVLSDALERGDMSKPMPMVRRPYPEDESRAARTLGRLVAFDPEAMAEVAFWSTLRQLEARRIPERFGETRVHVERREIRIRCFDDGMGRMTRHELPYELREIAGFVGTAFGASLITRDQHGSLLGSVATLAPHTTITLTVEPIAHVWSELAERYGAAVRMPRARR